MKDLPLGPVPPMSPLGPTTPVVPSEPGGPRGPVRPVFPVSPEKSTFYEDNYYQKYLAIKFSFLSILLRIIVLLYL